MKKLMNFRPALFIAVMVIMAVVSSYFFFVAKNFTAGVILTSLILACFLVIPLIAAIVKKKNIIKTLVFSAVAFILSLAAFFNFYARIYAYDKAGIGDKYLTVKGTVDEIENFDGGMSVIIGDVEFSGVLKGKTDYRINAYVYGDSGIDVGDTVTFSSTVSDKALIYEGRFAANDVGSGVRYYSQVNASEITVTGDSANIFQSTNTAIRNALKSGLNKNEFAVAYALLCGNSEYTGTDALSPYRQAGVAHIFAVSGLHIGFLAAVIGFILNRLKLTPYAAVIITGVLLLFYSGVCGFSASSLRASIMCVTAMSVAAVGGRYDGLSSVSVAAIILAVIFPTQVFCAGFVLSFSVVYGIILLGSPIAKLLRFMPKKLASSVSTVFAAQIFSVPVLIAFFGEFSLIAVLANIIFIPIVGVIYVLLFLGVILSFISPAFLYVQDKMLYVINYLFTTAVGKGIMIGGFALTVFTVFYYLSALILCGIINLTKTVKIVLSMACIIIFATTTAVYTVNEASGVKAYVIGSSGICATVIEGTCERTVIVSHAERWFSLSRIKRLYRLNGEKDTYVVVLNGVEVNSLMTKLNSVSDVKAVNYFGNEDYSSVYENSFKNIKFTKTEPDAKITMSDYIIAFSANGRAAIVASGGDKICVFGEFGSTIDSFGFPENDFNLVVIYDYADRIAAEYKNTKLLSYRNSTVTDDAERQGNFKYNFNLNKSKFKSFLLQSR